MRKQHPRHRIDVDRYYAMVPEGGLAEDARVELIEGEIVDMPPIGCCHALLVRRLTQRFFEAVGRSAVVSAQLPVRLDRYSEPQPDLALLAPRDDEYGGHHPDAHEALLVVEISDSTLQYDLNVKSGLYARHGVREVWAVDVRGQRVHFLRSPEEGHFAERSCSETPGVVSPAALRQVQIDLTGLFDH